MQRIWRDFAVAARHAVVLPVVGYEVYGKALLDVENSVTPLGLIEQEKRFEIRRVKRKYGGDEMTKRFEPKVFQLGYVGLQCADFEQSRDHYLGLIGLTETAKGDGGESYLSVGFEHHNIVLKKSDRKSLLHVGYQLKPDLDLEEFARDLDKLGLRPQIKSDSQPGVAKLVECEVVAGNVFQFYSHIDAPAPGFKTSGVAPLRLGHVAVICAEAEKLIAFYRDFPRLLENRRHWRPCDVHDLQSAIIT